MGPVRDAGSRYPPFCVTEVAAAQGRYQQAAVLVAELNHSGVHSGDGLNREDDES